MTIRFAAPRNALKTRMSAELVAFGVRQASNDNGEIRAHDPVLDAALRHFSQHGLAAARQARRCAELAHAHGDMDAYQWWLGICRTLDRRMARELVAETSGAA